VLQFAEESLNEVAASVDLVVNAALDLAVALRWDVGHGSTVFGSVENVLGVISPISDKVAGPAETCDEREGGLLVGGLASGQGEADGQALTVDDDVDLGA
jgi:hypothetical protein